MYQNPQDVRFDGGVRVAVRFTTAVALLAGAFLAVAAVWVSTCGGSVADALACGTPQRTFLALGAPVILLGGAVRAFVRAFGHRRRTDTWWAWQGSAWLLIALMVLVAVTGAPVLAGR
ncbi:hypothetical protein [Mycolicibacterium litorale]|uniref:Transmembrane protein n=1 Tax=Mycolicibacterium litorale TaxID=758802 RepID=A0AAD1MUS5_9MYCO|nr:hypothetical protein [Mycolicibacterium litorale]MCV7416097.1 hypothetical protein [Mycolicibacterium litorale]TDY09348.1 hypothetical protein BCL50_1439 [Mycolicibacterium litorale]BBY17293.1 hypothetical protein MLIT_28850 [Mycolicibacterium litorale]